MAEQNLFEELKAVLADLKTFLEENADDIRPAIQAIASLIPQVNELIDLLVDLLEKLKKEVDNLDVSGIPGVAQVAEFTGKIPALLDAAKKLLPDETASIEAIADVTDVVTGLPSIEEVKTELSNLLQAIIDLIISLKS
jgi:ABC-type transporter Mla subunit MlaD